MCDTLHDGRRSCGTRNISGTTGRSSRSKTNSPPAWQGAALVFTSGYVPIFGIATIAGCCRTVSSFPMRSTTTRDRRACAPPAAQADLAHNDIAHLGKSC